MDAKESEVWARKHIGPYAVPDRAAVNEAGLYVIAQDGEMIEGIHRGTRIDYGSDPDALTSLRKSPIGTQETCSCSQSGVQVALPNPAFEDVDRAQPANAKRPATTTRGGTAARACIRCDAVHLMPSFDARG